MKGKQKIVQGRGPSNINVDIFGCYFDVCWASLPVPSINYGGIMVNKGNGFEPSRSSLLYVFVRILGVDLTQNFDKIQRLVMYGNTVQAANRIIVIT